MSNEPRNGVPSSADAATAPLQDAAGSPVTALDIRRIGDYQILRRLGEGGMGAVYLGYQEGKSRHVAIKILPDSLAANEDYVQRFLREARSISRLDHPNIVRFIDVGKDAASSKHYLVLEFVDGPSAHALLDQFGQLSVGDATHIALDIARALEHAHSRRIIHRDIKPDNILLTRSGVAKLADLGLAKHTDEESHLTGARQGFGTPFYMPYEQSISAKQADIRSDIYALGATLYHLLTGHVPFPGPGPIDIAEQKDRGRFLPASKRNPAVPPALDQILSRMMARNPKDRYQTASELIIDLERSGLATSMPSFVDPDLALQDPLVRARLATPAQPTVPNTNGPVQRPRAPRPNPDIWYLRYRNEEGRWRRARLTTQQVRRRLAEGRFVPTVEGSHELRGEYHPLRFFKEFRQTAVPQRETRVPSHTPANTAAPGPAAARGVFLEYPSAWLIPLGISIVLAVAALSYYYFRH
jgi:serine/threonine-protein kinase